MENQNTDSTQTNVVTASDEITLFDLILILVRQRVVIIIGLLAGLVAGAALPVAGMLGIGALAEQSLIVTIQEQSVPRALVPYAVLAGNAGSVLANGASPTVGTLTKNFVDAWQLENLPTGVSVSSAKVEAGLQVTLVGPDVAALENAATDLRSYLLGAGREEFLSSLLPMETALRTLDPPEAEGLLLLGLVEALRQRPDFPWQVRVSETTPVAGGRFSSPAVQFAVVFLGVWFFSFLIAFLVEYIQNMGKDKVAQERWRKAWRP